MGIMVRLNQLITSISMKSLPAYYSLTSLFISSIWNLLIKCILSALVDLNPKIELVLAI